MNKRFLQIDELSLSDHYYLNEEDVCFYLGEYTAGKGHAFSKTNQLIHNFKKGMDKQNTSQWKYKEQAIVQVATIFKSVINPKIKSTFVPIPPSKAKNHPLYDDRIAQALKLTCRNQDWDMRELVLQTCSLDAAHLSQSRPTPAELLENYNFVDALSTPTPERIFIVDDVLTTGCHFKAMKKLLSQKFPNTEIYGLFIARRVPSDDFDFDMDL